MFLMLYLAETHSTGYYPAGDVLFTSQTNNVDVKFTSDYSVTSTGFRLNIRSISCSDHDNFPPTVVNPATTQEPSTSAPVHTSEMPDNCDAQEVEITEGQVIPGALVIHTGSDGNYSNNACQHWNIIADENQVYVLLSNLINNYLTMQNDKNISFVLYLI